MKQKILSALCAVSMTVGMSGSVMAVQGNYDDWWWNPAMSGMGLSVGQKDDTLVVAWYHFDADQQPIYLMLSGRLEGNVLSGPLFRTKGPQPGLGYDPRKVQRIPAGTASIEFQGTNQAILNYNYEGRSGQIPLQRYVYKRTRAITGSAYGAVHVLGKQCEGSGTEDGISFSYALQAAQSDNLIPQFTGAQAGARSGGGYALQPQVTYKKGHTFKRGGILMSSPSSQSRFTCTYQLGIVESSQGWSDGGSTLNCQLAMEGGVSHKQVNGTYSGPLVMNRVFSTADAYIADYSATTTNGTVSCQENGWIIVQKQTP